MISREYAEEDFLLLSGIQHFAYCRRQWALIHIENQWSDNYFTATGNIIHEKAHDPFLKEKRGDTVIVRAMPIHSFSLGLSGECDVVELKRCNNGIALNGFDGKWSVCPIEYKRGAAKADDCDRLQLAAQVICLEEMLACDITNGCLYYDKSHRRESVEITDELKQTVRKMSEEMHKLFSSGYTPRVKASKKCDLCSLKEVCVPKLMGRMPVADYILSHIEPTGEDV